MNSSTPNIFSLCCCFVFLAAVAGLAFAVPASRRAILRALGRNTAGGPLPWRLAQLSAAALPGLRERVYGLSPDELQLVSELVASIQLAQELVFPGYRNRAISDGLQGDPATV